MNAKENNLMELPNNTLEYDGVYPVIFIEKRDSFQKINLCECCFELRDEEDGEDDDDEYLDDEDDGYE